MELTVSYFFLLGKLFLTEIWYLKVRSINKESTTTTPHLKKKTIISKKGKKGQGFFVPVPPQGYWDDDCVKNA